MPHGGIAGQRTLFNVKINNIEILKQTRGEAESDPVEAAVICEKAGCNGITVQLREDRRQIQEWDVFALKEVIQGKFNLEISLSDEMIAIASKVKPDQLTFVPEKSEEMTAEGGLDVRQHQLKIKDAVKLFHDQNIPVSLLVEPDRETIDLAKDCGADFVELHTGAYGNIADKTGIDKEIGRILSAFRHTEKVRIKVSAGHGLNYKNIEPLLDVVGLPEVNIGHSILSRAVSVGLARAVDEMLLILE